MIARSFLRGAIWTSACLVAAAPTLAAQIPTVIHGRVEDIDSGKPVAGARVFSIDSVSVVLTDSAGAFVIQVPPGDPLALLVERIGYLAQRFDLPQESLSRLSVLLLEPAAVELEGVSVVVEQAIEVLQRNLQRRRNFFQGAIRAFHRERLDRFAPVGRVYDLIRQQIPAVFPCRSDPGHLCLRGPATFRDPDPTYSLTICIDGHESIAPIDELNLIPIDAVALVEFYGRVGVKVYTSDWMLFSARTGRTRVMPDTPFGLSC